MSVLYEHYQPSVNDDETPRSNWLVGQSFLATSGHNVTSVKLKLYNTTGAASTLTVNLYLADGSGFPTGSPLASGTINTNIITQTALPGGVYEIVFGTPYTLTSGVNYVLEIERNTTSANVKVCLIDIGTYADGFNSSNVSGAGWTNNSPIDIYFEIWGDPITYTLSLVHGSFVLTGYTMSFTRALVISLVRGLYALSGQNVGFVKSVLMSLATGYYTLTGYAVALTEIIPFRFKNLVGVTYDPTDQISIFAERLNEMLNRLHDLDGGDPLM